LIRRLLSSTALAAAVALAASGVALAQSAPVPAPTPAPAPAQPAPSAVQGVTVTGQTSDIRTSIDRRSYDITQDLTATTGSIADALRNVPSVDVDLNGNVSLRGDAAVTILVDGKPSPLFTGPSAGQALQSMPADQYERVEVMTNPSAAFSPDGSAGIINLISKKSHKAGATGSVRMNVGDDGRGNAGVTFNHQGDKLTWTFNAGFRTGDKLSDNLDRRQAFDSTGALVSATRASSTDPGHSQSWTLRAGIDYDLDAQTRLSAEAHGFGYVSHDTTYATTVTTDAAGAVIQDLVRTADQAIDHSATGASASLRRGFAGDDHDLVVSLSHDRGAHIQDTTATDINLVPVLPAGFDSQRNVPIQNLTVLKADYERPMPAQGKFKVGYQLGMEADSFSNMGFLEAASPAGPFDPGEADQFSFGRSIQALYATYEQPFGKLTVLAGLRGETTHLSLGQPTTGFRSERDDAQLYPTLHLAYAIDDAQQLVLSYSKRVDRPDPEDFDPFRYVASPFDVYQGNPDLKPEQTNAFEAGYQYKQGSGVYLATLFVKLNHDGETPVVTNLGNGVFLTTQENLARSTSQGLELVASGKLGEAVTYNLSSVTSWDVIAPTLLSPVQRSAFVASGHGTVSWRATDRDTVQVNGTLMGKTLTAQGYREPTGLVNLGWRHKVNEAFSVVFTAQDALDTLRYGNEIDTALLRDHSDNHTRQRTFYLGLTYSFGAGVKHDQGFDFGTGN
jgi:outer membrane receptor protein involved in Fe transport